MKLPFVTRAKYDKDMKQINSSLATLQRQVNMLQTRVEYLYNEKNK